MAYIGNSATTQSFAPAVDYFSGTGATTAFTLSRPVASVAQIQVVIENVPQNPSSAYTVSSNTITFTSAPPLGINNIYVEYTSPITQTGQPGQGTVGQAQLSSNIIMYENNQVISTSYTITSGHSAMSAGPITINSGVTVSIPAGSRWVVL